MKFHVIGDEDTVTGFSLVGIPGTVAGNQEQTLGALQEAQKNQEIEVIFITERLAAQISAEVEAIVFGGKFPLVLEIPDRGGPLEGRLHVRDIVRKAVGVNV